MTPQLLDVIASVTCKGCNGEGRLACGGQSMDRTRRIPKIRECEDCGSSGIDSRFRRIPK